MENNFQQNLRKLAEKYTQKEIALKTGFSQSSINNYLSKTSEPSMQFLIALNKAFGTSIDDFLFSDFTLENNVNYDRYIGNYFAYYYNNTQYKGEIHANLKNTLNYGVISIIKDSELTNNVSVKACFHKDRQSATNFFKKLEKTRISKEINSLYDEVVNMYAGELNVTDQTISILINNKDKDDQSYIILNNPQSKSSYIGGIGTVNTISHGREHNPCIQYIILSPKPLEIPDGEIYECLKLNDYAVKFDDNIKDVVELFKRLYASETDLATELSDSQKIAIIKNKLEYHFNQILSANAFRFAKVSNKEDDSVYKFIRESLDV